MEAAGRQAVRKEGRKRGREVERENAHRPTHIYAIYDVVRSF